MKVALVINEKQNAAVEAAGLAKTHLENKGIAAYIVNSFEQSLVQVASLDGPDLIIALGGDGTLLKAFHLFEHALAPLMGINFGKMGFLSGALAKDLFDAIDYALSPDCHKETRTLLDVTVTSDAESEPLHATVLNEVVIGRNQIARVIATSLTINGHDIYTLRGDGLIIATATGSTAYALSAGGPIISPGYEGMVIVPLASHTLVQRAIVTAPDDRAMVAFPEEFKSQKMILVDGRVLDIAGAKITSIEVAPSTQKLELIKLDSRLFYDTVSQNFFAGG
jgi:NAD+ kinase